MTKEERKEYNKKYRLKNREKIKEYNSKNRENFKRYQKKYRLKNRNLLLQKQKEYYIENIENQREYQKEYIKNRRKNDINFKLACNLRGRLNKAIKNNQKTGSAINDLGCSIEQLKIYLQSKFQFGMTWANYGEWQIDHIVPISSFDLTNREQLCKACHFTNLQPLWKKENLMKSNNI